MDPRWCRGLIVGAAVAAAAALSAAPVAAVVESPRCAVAGALAESGSPREAAVLIDQVRKQVNDPGACAAAAAAVNDTLATVEATLKEADEYVAILTATPGVGEHTPSSEKDWGDVGALADQALALDSANARAKALQAAATAGQAAEEKATAKKSTSKSWIDRLAKVAQRWTDVRKDAAKDAGLLLGVAASTLALIFLAARVLLLLPPIRSPRPEDRVVVPPRELRSPTVSVVADGAVVLVAVLFVPRLVSSGVNAPLAWLTVPLALLCLLLLEPVVTRRVLRRPPRIVRPALRIGAAVLLGIAILVLAAVARETATWQELLVWLGCVAFVLALLATIVVNWSWLFHRLRVRIDIQEKGEVGKAGAAAIVAHLRELGASPPRGLEIPLGSDAETLSGSNITSAAKGTLGTILGTIQGALAITPWRVLVDTVSLPATASEAETHTGAPVDGDSAKSAEAPLDATVVVITRHGRVVDTAVIEPRLRGGTGPVVDPYRMVAARALMSILTAENAFDGMGGAKHWRSIGLQYDATARGHHEEPARLLMLAESVRIDPGNWAARLSYRMELDQKSEDAPTLGRLANWLWGAAGMVKPADRALKARMLYAALATRMNYEAALEGTPEPPNQVVAQSDLRAALTAAVADQDLDPQFRARLRLAEKALQTPTSRDFLTRIPQYANPDEAVTQLLVLDPTTAYSYACHFAAKRNGESWDVDAAIWFLRFALHGQVSKDLLKADPSLKALRGTSQYRQEFGETLRQDLMEFEPFAFHRAKLAPAGLTEPAAIAAYPTTILVTLLGVDAATAAIIHERAALIADIPKGLIEHRLEITEVLVAKGLPTIAGVRALTDPQKNAVVEAISEACKERSISDPAADVLREWLDGPTPPAP